MEQAQLIDISNLADHPCAGRRLGLDRNKTFLGIERCPIDFQWKSEYIIKHNMQNRLICITYHI